LRSQQWLPRLRPGSLRWLRKSRLGLVTSWPLQIFFKAGRGEEIFMSGHRFDGFTSIESGHLDGWKYNSMEHKLTVRFKNGYQYTAFGVGPEDHQEFMSAPSQGEHWHRVIKNGFHVERVR
jgi:hypothetical protein